MAEKIVSPLANGNRRPDQLPPRDSQIEVAVWSRPPKMRHVKLDDGQGARLTSLTDGRPTTASHAVGALFGAYLCRRSTESMGRALISTKPTRSLGLVALTVGYLRQHVIECAPMWRPRTRPKRCLLAAVTALGVAGCGSTHVVTRTITETHTVTTPIAGKMSDVLVSPSIAMQAPAVREPKEFEFSADGSGFARISSWTSWTSTEATGSATMELNNCNPNCAQGTFTSYTGILLLSDPQPCPRAPAIEVQRVLFVANPGEAYPRDASKSWPLECVAPASKQASISP